MDTHSAVKKLINSGMPEKQAESVVEIQAMLLYQNLATKADLAAFRANMKSAFAEIRADIIRWLIVINFTTMILVALILKYL